MKSKSSSKKQSVALSDLKIKKDPKGGFPVGSSIGTKTSGTTLTVTGQMKSGTSGF